MSIIWNGPSGLQYQYQLEKPKSTGGKMKEYFEKHQNMIFTLLTVFVIDHLLLKGALRKKLEALAHKMLEGAEKELKGDKST